MDIRETGSQSFLYKAKTFAAGNGALLALLLMIIAATLAYEDFFTVYNITNVLNQNSMMGLVALGMAFVIITGGIDLSVGSTIALGAVLAASLSVSAPIWVILLVPVLAGTLVGVTNGLLITRLNIVPFIATLATMMAVRGFVLLYTNELSIPVNSEVTLLKTIGRGYLFDVIPYPIIIFVIIAAALLYVIKYTSFGRSVYAIGGSEDVARMMGLNVKLNIVLCYALTGFLAGLAGLLLAGRLAAGQPTAGEGWEMDIVASVAIGGTLLSGGVGGISNTIYGIFIIGLIKNIINMQGDISSYWQRIIMGLILLAVIVVQNRSHRKPK